VQAVKLAGQAGTFTVGPGSHEVGRGITAAIRIDDRQVSRSHAVLLVAGPNATIEDKGSANGTFVNGEQVTGTRPLRDGDRLAFGELEFTVRIT
jgi:pSer/pThr/pTyr-binding forkhead associated (FHA) protein